MLESIITYAIANGMHASKIRQNHIAMIQVNDPSGRRETVNVQTMQQLKGWLKT